MQIKETDTSMHICTNICNAHAKMSTFSRVHYSHAHSAGSAQLQHSKAVMEGPSHGVIQVKQF